MNAGQLSQLIEKIVAKRVTEELTKRLPMMVESMITKRYLRDLVSERVQDLAPRPSRLKEVMSDDDDEVPGPMNNTDHGIYHKDPMVKEQKRPSKKVAIDKLAKGDSSFAALFEDVTPVGHPDSPMSAPEHELVSESTLTQAFDMERIQRLAKAVVPQRKKQQVDTGDVFQARRQMLDERIVRDGAPPKAAQFEVPRHRVSEVFDEDPLETRMREIENRRNHLGL